MRPARLFAAFVLGGILGTVGDQLCHVRFGVLWYPRPEPGLFGQPWWVAPQFGVASVVALLSAIPFARAARTRTPETWISPIATGFLWFAAAYLASGVFQRQPVELTVAYGLLFAGRVALRPDRGPVIAGAILMAIGGPAWEIALSRAGFFFYRHPAWVIPMWLPGIYLHAAPLAIAITQALDRPKMPSLAKAGSATIAP